MKRSFRLALLTMAAFPCWEMKAELPRLESGDNVIFSTDFDADDGWTHIGEESGCGIIGPDTGDPKLKVWRPSTKGKANSEFHLPEPVDLPLSLYARVRIDEPKTEPSGQANRFSIVLKSKQGLTAALEIRPGKQSYLIVPTETSHRTYVFTGGEVVEFFNSEFMDFRLRLAFDENGKPYAESAVFDPETKSYKVLGKVTDIALGKDNEERDVLITDLCIASNNGFGFPETGMSEKASFDSVLLAK